MHINKKEVANVQTITLDAGTRVNGKMVYGREEVDVPETFQELVGYATEGYILRVFRGWMCQKANRRTRYDIKRELG